MAVREAWVADELEPSLKLRCPPFDPAAVAGVAGRGAVAERIAALNALLTPVERCFGLELRRGYRCLLDGEHRRQAGDRPADAEVCRRSLRELMVRPAVEPVALSYWRRFVHARLDLPSLVELAAGLAARPVPLSPVAMATRPLPGFPRVEFEPPDQARLWLDKLGAAERAVGHALDWPVYAYAQVVLSHPLTDGNGRLARAVLQGALARRLGLRAPALALAPACYLKRRRITQALAALSATGDWPAFFAVMLPVLGEAAAAAEAVLGGSPG